MLKNTVNTPSRKRFAILLGFLLSVIAVRYAFQIDIPRLFFTLVIIVIALLGDRNEIMALIICCIPLHESVDLFYSLVSCVLVYILRFHRSIRINSGISVFFLMMIWELLHCFGSSFSPVQFLSSMIPLIVLAVIMCADTSDLDYPLVVRSLSYTTLSVAATLFLKLLNTHDFNFVAAVTGLQRLGIVIEGAEQSSLVGGLINPNALGIICVLAATGLMQLLNMKAGTRSDMIVACTVIVFGALTASRTFLVCLAFMAILLVATSGETLGKKLQFAGILVLLVLLAAAVLYILFPDLLEYYIGRFLVKDITTGRMGLMQQYHEFITKNLRVLCFGIGLQDFNTRLVEVYRAAYHVPHNSIQELTAAWGIPGVFLFAEMIFAMYRTSGRLWSRKKLLHSIPLLIILLKGMAGQMINSYYTMLAFSYAYLSLCADLKDRKEKPGIRQNPKDFPAERV